MRKIILVLISVFVVQLAALARNKKQRDPELCQIQTVYVSGNSESAVLVRRELEKRTWLRLVRDPAEADGELIISETQSERNFPVRSQRTTVSGELRRGSALVWSDSAWFDEGMFNSGAGSAVQILLSRLNKQANCGK
jgi:hypothetical protein